MTKFNHIPRLHSRGCPGQLCGDLRVTRRQADRTLGNYTALGTCGAVAARGRARGVLRAKGRRELRSSEPGSFPRGRSLGPAASAFTCRKELQTGQAESQRLPSGLADSQMKRRRE